MIEHATQVYGKYVLPTSDPGTAHALLVALALGMGLDPRVGGLEVRWHYRCPGAPVWVIEASDTEVAFVRWDPRDVDDDGFDRELHAPTVANEPDPIRALELAVRHVLEGR